MNYTMAEVLQFTEENDVKFIRLAFFDIFGTMKNISIMPGDLQRAFESGVSFDASAVRGFMNEERSDLLLVPDPSTLSVLPWRPSHGRVIRMFCDIRHPDGTAFHGDNRFLLRTAAERAARAGYECRIGAKCEFYLFKLDEDGNPTLEPHDKAGYCDIAPLDKGENVRREICLTLEEMGLYPESSHHEQGPGQNEVAFQCSDALSAADNLATFKSVVKTIANQNGLFASFLPKPLPGRSGNGLHINLSLLQNGLNLFDGSHFGTRFEAEGFMEGVLRRIPEITAFLNPIPNSYARLGHCSAPKYVSWSHQNRAQLVRIPASCGEYSRMELRSPDPLCNPHLAFALLLNAGLDGMEQQWELRAPIDRNLASAGAGQDIPPLPENLEAAVRQAESSEFVRRILPADTLAKYLEAKRSEHSDSVQAADQQRFALERYFETA